ncbi:hypothetical protein GTW78_31550 [Streptomyces sp. SID4948]|uniref:hypothetical protein n=1 Tax=Streptomyces sp. SID4948 TaxID=2690287 RepID=UPI000B87D1DC|nr:hypothetical protein [Streptomyces sp. SID4948]
MPESRPHRESLDSLESVDSLDAEEPGDRFGPLPRGDSLGSNGSLHPLDALDPLDSIDPLDPLGSAEHLPPMEDGQSFGELRPQRRLRIWQLAPIIALAVGGSLMFAFPLAFESGDAGPVVAMLGLLLFCCAAGWGLMAARRIGQTWPGLPARGSGARPDWRYVLGYTAAIGLLAVLAVWRVARLR